MLHKQAALTDATVTDQGYFEAIAATWSKDRQNEQIRKGAFAQTIKNWQGSRKSVPVHWDHRGEAENIIGSIDPTKMIESDEGLHVEGKLDLETSETARQAWRSMKNGTISLSFGYLVLDDRKRDDGVRELLAIDLFEVTLTPSPANPETRVTSMKSASEGGVADREFEIHSGFFSDAYRRRDQRLRRDKEVEALASELDAKKAARAKAARPIKVRTFEL
jgi:uncharacterized protein